MDRSSQTQLLSAVAQTPTDAQSKSFGKASSKPWIDKYDFFALLVNFACFVLAVLTTLPHFSFSWRLGLKNQIVTIGVVLNIQRFCFERVMQNSFILLEARLGKSVLQNYDAILRNQFIGSHVDVRWRSTLCILSFLPTALSIAYKQFLSGTSTAPVANDDLPDALYGLAYPDLGSYASLSNSIYLSLNANSEFLNASIHDEEYPADTDFPWAYGYNTLVLGEDSAALLDLPLRASIDQIQRKMAPNETWQLSADVDAFVATRNDSNVSLRQDRGFLDRTMHHAYNGFASASLFQDTMPYSGFGWMSANDLSLGDAYCLMGIFGNDSVGSQAPTRLTDNSFDDAYLDFMDSAQMFSIRRQGCRGKWKITQFGVKLLEGSCFDQLAVNSSIIHGWQSNPYAFDALPVLVNTIASFGTTRPSTSPWKQVSYAVSAANMWWARSAYRNYGGSHQGEIFRTYPETQYKARSQSITSTRPTLDATWGLYLIVAVFPIITLILFIPILVLYSLPIGTEFGLTSILAGIDRDSLILVRGAALSGKLVRKINLEISSEAVANNQPNGAAESGNRIRYALSERTRQPIRAGIEHGQKYE